MRMFYANGYNASLDEATAQARRGNAEQDLPRPRSLQLSGYIASAFPQQQPPPSPPLPKLAPSAGEVAGIGIGLVAASIFALIMLNRHRAGDIIFDAGYQFEMVGGSPLTLDARRVAAAMAASNDR